MPETNRLTRTIKDFLTTSGAVAVGITTTEDLAGGPPSSDLSYVLPEAKSAVSFALPLDQAAIETFLSKKDFHSHNRDNRLTNTLATGLATELAVFLDLCGHKSVAVPSNFSYRKDTPNGAYDEIPTISHRYLAVRSGVGHFGLSGNVIHKDIGAAIILGSVVTEADLLPTAPLPAEDNYCDRCRLCMSACASGMMNEKKDVTVTLGGLDFSYSKRRTHHRCDYVCGGFAGLSASGRWSTFSPARFPIPEKDDEFLMAILNAADAYKNRKKPFRGFFHGLMPGKELSLTCGHCQLICHPDKAVRKKRFKMITESGCVVQHADGSLEALTPEAAAEHVANLDQETRALYEVV
jgi:epoxyqueuosine reductase